MKAKQQSVGFTLVELTLAISFIAILLLAITMLIMQTASIYNKGLTLREANQAGQFISSEVQRSLNQTYSKAVEEVEFTDNTGGRLCAGTVVYAWNYADEFWPVARSGTINSLHNSSEVRFVKFPGVKADYCQTQSDGSWRPLPSDAKELLAEGNANIALHSFSFDRLSVVNDDTQTIYAIKMVVGTPSNGLINGSSCRVGEMEDDEWCAVNQFSFTARSGNREALQ